MVQIHVLEPSLGCSPLASALAARKGRAAHYGGRPPVLAGARHPVTTFVKKEVVVDTRTGVAHLFMRREARMPECKQCGKVAAFRWLGGFHCREDGTPYELWDLPENPYVWADLLQGES